MKKKLLLVILTLIAILSISTTLVLSDPGAPPPDIDPFRIELPFWGQIRERMS